MTVAFLVGGAAVERGEQVVMFLTKEAVRLAIPGYAEAVACDGCPPLSRLLELACTPRRFRCTFETWRGLLHLRLRRLDQHRGRAGCR